MTTLPTHWPNAEASKFIRNGGVEWHVQDMGQGPVLLLIHGTGAATHSWRDILPLVAQHFRVIAIDLPGHGYTKGRPAGGLSLPGIAVALASLLSDMGTEPALVVGHSAGAAVAVRMALNKGADAKPIVAIAPALLPFPGIAQHIFPTMAKLLFVNPFAPHVFARIARQPGAVGKFLARSTGSEIDASGVEHYTRLFSTAGHCAGAIAMMAEWNLEPLKQALPGLDVPLLVLHGDQDSAIPLTAAREAALLVPGAYFEQVDGTGHLLHEEMPNVTAERIIAFARDRAILPDEEEKRCRENITA